MEGENVCFISLINTIYAFACVVSYAFSNCPFLSKFVMYFDMLLLLAIKHNKKVPKTIQSVACC